MAIILQSTVGGFSWEFRRRLGALEQAMIAHGFDPNGFVIAKDCAALPVPFVGPFFYDYTVFFGDDHFTVTQPNDLVFFDYFYRRIIAEEDEAPRRRGVIQRFLDWMSQPI
ncbi:MAG: hypothetical protein ACREDL_20420 [Bradyrhizobium sp.]